MAACNSQMHVPSFLLVFVFVLHLVIPSSLALTCYESDDEGTIFEVTNSSWTYCALVPASGENKGKLFGLGEKNDNTEQYDNTFRLSTEDKAYKILTVCIFEKYDFGTFSPRFKVPPEFLFRCVCNYNRCNSATTFGAYLKAMRIDNM